MSRSDSRINTATKPWAVIELWNGKKISGTLLDEYEDGTATVEWSRGPWRGKLISKRENHPVNEE